MTDKAIQIDDMQNKAIGTMEKRIANLEKQHSELQVQFADLMGRMDLIIKGIKWMAGAVALGLGVDLHPMLMTE